MHASFEGSLTMHWIEQGRDGPGREGEVAS